MEQKITRNDIAARVTRMMRTLLSTWIANDERAYLPRVAGIDHAMQTLERTIKGCMNGDSHDYRFGMRLVLRSEIYMHCTDLFPFPHTWGSIDTLVDMALRDDTTIEQWNEFETDCVQKIIGKYGQQESEAHS